MISVGSRDGRKGLGLELEMEETELEEGEALGCNDGDEDSAIDPDIALSYIEEKLQNVLGHFQKDFEGGVSAENLGAKFGGYGSFLPTYQRSPSWPHARNQQEVHNSDSSRSPRKLPLEDRRQSSLASSSASPLAEPCDASGKTSSMGNSLKGDAYIPSRHAEESSSKYGVVMKSVNPSDQRTLKVRLRVGSESFSIQKNAEIYSGLGLVVSPSSSLDDSPATSEGLCGKVLEVPEESPSSILEIMTSVPRGLLLSPLPEDLIFLTEKRKPRVKSESIAEEKAGIQSPVMLSNGFHSKRSNQKVLEHKKLKSSENYDVFSNKTSYKKNYDDLNDNGSLLKKVKEPDIDALGYEELVSNALKLPLLSSSRDTIADPEKRMSTPTTVPVIALKDEVKGETFSEVTEKEHLLGEFFQDIDISDKLGGKKVSSSKVPESKKGNNVDNFVAYTQQDVLKAETYRSSDQYESSIPKVKKSLGAEPTDPLRQGVVQIGGPDSEEVLNPAPENSSTGGKRKPKRVHSTSAQGAYVPENQLAADYSVTSKREKSTHVNGILSKTDSHDRQKDHEKPRDRYKDFFGDVEFEDDDNESNSGEMTSSGKLIDAQQVGKMGFNEHYSPSNEKSSVRRSEKLCQSEKDPRVTAQLAPPLGNGPSSEPPTAMDPLVHEEWVYCERCEKWRLLPLGTNPKSLPDKWICRMLNWLPGMNRCSIPEDVTTNALRALYHPAASVPAGASESQHDWLKNSVLTSVGVASMDARNSQEDQTVAGQTTKISRNKKHGPTSATYSTDIDGSTHSSNSQKKNLLSSGKNNSLNRGNRSPVLGSCGYQQKQQANGDINKPNDNIKDGEVSLVNSSDKGMNLKIRSKRESDPVGSGVSKRIKSEGLRDDENCASDNGEAFSKAGRGHICGLTIKSGDEWLKYTNYKDSRGSGTNNIVSVVDPEMHAPGTSDGGLLHSGKSDDKKRKRKEYRDSQIHAGPLSSSGRHHQGSGDSMEVMREKGHQKGKKARVSKSGEKDTSGNKANDGTDRKSGGAKEQQKGQYLNNPLIADYSKCDMGSVQHSLAANSSSSKVSVSHNNKTSTEDVKCSPVESVSSSPLRLSDHNPDKVTSTRRSLVEKYDVHDSGSLTVVSSRKFSSCEDDEGINRTGIVKKNSILPSNDHGTDVYNDHSTDVYNDHIRQNNQYASEKRSSEQCQVEEIKHTQKSQNSESHSKRSGKVLSSRSKHKNRTSVADINTDKMKASDFSRGELDHMPSSEEKSSRRRKLDDKSGTPSKADMFIVKKDAAQGTWTKNSKGQKQKDYGSHHGPDVIKSQDKNHNLDKELDAEKLPKKNNHAEGLGTKKSNALPPLARAQVETVAIQKPDSGSRKQNDIKVLAVDALDNGHASKVLNQSNKAENQNGQPITSRQPTPTTHKVQDVEAPSPLRKESSSHAANSAIKEAKDLKHLADRLKNNGSTESIGYYFQAVLKFLNGASLFESGSSEGTKQNDIAHAMHIYSSTAKLCEYCAHEYEKSKDMAAAALAYKCTEVAYMRVVYSSHTTAIRDRNELQTALQVVPPGESPSSSASDVDNLNHQAITDKAPLAKVLGSPQVSGSHIISSRNRAGFLRLLNFAQEVNFAMEASRKSRIAYTAATSRLGETPQREGISSLKKALDFNFQDVEGLLRLVRVAMEAISR